MQLICHVAIFDYVTCHNLESSLTIIMDDGDQYFKYIYIYIYIYISKKVVVPRVRF
jgi:hypothetical protein